MMKYRNLFWLEQTEKLLCEDIIRLIESSKDNQSQKGKICDEIHQFTKAVESFATGLESIRRRAFKDEKAIIEEVEALVKKNVFNAEVREKVEAIKTKLDQTIIQDSRFVTEMRSASSTNQRSATNIAGRIEQLTQIRGKAKNLKSQIHSLLKELPRKVISQPWKSRTIIRNLRAEVLQLLEAYEAEVSSILVLNIEIDSAEATFLEYIRVMKEALQQVESYVDLSKEREQLDKLIKRLKGLVTKEITRGAKYDTWLARVVGALKEKEKSSLQFSLLRPDLIRAHESGVNEPDDSQIVVHMTNYFPKKGVIFTTQGVGVFRGIKTGELLAGQVPRNTLHFSINHAVRPVKHGFGESSSWVDKKYAILIPMKNFPKDRIEDFHPTDMWILGKLRIPGGSVILAKRQTVLDELAGAKKHFPDVQRLTDFFRKKGIAVIILGEEYSKIPLTAVVDEYIRRMGRLVPQHLYPSEAHFFSEWGGGGGQEAKANVAKNFKHWFSEESGYHKEKGLEGLIKPYLYSYVPTLMAVLLREIVGVVKYAYEPEKKKVYLVVLHYAIESLDFFDNVLAGQIEALKASDVQNLPEEEQQRVIGGLQVFSSHCLSALLDPKSEHGKKIRDVVDLLKNTLPNTHKEIKKILTRLVKKAEEYRIVLYTKYGGSSSISLMLSSENHQDYDEISRQLREIEYMTY